MAIILRAEETNHTAPIKLLLRGPYNNSLQGCFLKKNSVCIMCLCSKIFCTFSMKYSMLQLGSMFMMFISQDNSEWKERDPGILTTWCGFYLLLEVLVGEERWPLAFPKGILDIPNNWELREEECQFSWTYISGRASITWSWRMSKGPWIVT